MIIPNGEYTIEKHSGGGADKLGRPLEAKAEWSDPSPCRIAVKADNRRSIYEDGIYREAEFSVLVDGVQPIPVTRVKLYRQGESLGEYNIIRAVPLEAVDATRIVVSNQ